MPLDTPGENTDQRGRHNKFMVSIFDMFTVGIGPSSSHTVGPMRAAAYFVEHLHERGQLRNTQRVQVRLFGSLGSTGKGHGTDKAVLAGLAGHYPETVDPKLLPALMAEAVTAQKLVLAESNEEAKRNIMFDPAQDLLLEGQKQLPFHPNALCITAYADQNKTEELYNEIWYSTGGGFVTRDGDENTSQKSCSATNLPHVFRSGSDLLAICENTGLTIPQIMMANEISKDLAEHQVIRQLSDLWHVMDSCINDGMSATGKLPGTIGLNRRAHHLHEELLARRDLTHDPLAGVDWVSIWAIAVNEQNASGERIVTAPTNGAAGILPAVLKYVLTFATANDPIEDEKLAADFLLSAGAIGLIFKATASISGAEVGCQGEVGVACSMAAAGLTQALGGSPRQVCNAAEIGMEHNLGLTCDPVDGLVQVPCIERNAVGAVTAITAARLALASSEKQLVSLDEVCATMMATGKDMQAKYKETSQGGLAVNVKNC